MQIDYSKRIFGLDFMRAIAIIMVVGSHLFWIMPNTSGILPDIMSISGVLGVEIFFVLSGFLIGRILYRLYISEDFSLSKVYYFWIRRWFRTLPNYYLILLINIIIVAFIGNQLPDNLWHYFFFLQNFASEMPSFFSESWSLSIEEFAYIIGPFILFLTLFIKTKISKSRLFVLMTLFIIILFFVSKLIYSFHETMRDMRYWNINVKALVIYRVDAVYYGVLAAYISSVKPEFWKRTRYYTFSIGVIIIICLNTLVAINGIFIVSHPMFWNVWYFVLTSLGILLALPLLSSMKSAPNIILKPITYISIISYAIYLLHYSIVMQLMKYYLPTTDLAGLDVVIYISVYLMLTMVLSYLLYNLYEKPIMDIRDKPFFGGK